MHGHKSLEPKNRPTMLTCEVKIYEDDIGNYYDDVERDRQTGKQTDRQTRQIDR